MAARSFSFGRLKMCEEKALPGLPTSQYDDYERTQEKAYFLSYTSCCWEHFSDNSPDLSHASPNFKHYRELVGHEYYRYIAALLAKANQANHESTKLKKRIRRKYWMD